MSYKKNRYNYIEKKPRVNPGFKKITSGINNTCKIFVGNVPYHCTQVDFEKCFENVDGFIKAEVVTIFKTNMSRGFGFVTMRSFYDGEKLKRRNDITFKGRVLRFTSYQQNDNDCETNNYIFVNNIPPGKNKIWLRNIFSDYEPIQKCFIMMNHESGEIKNCGIIEVLDDTKYKSIIAKKYHNIDEIVLETTKYKSLNNIYNFLESSLSSDSLCHCYNYNQMTENYEQNGNILPTFHNYCLKKK